MGGRRYDLGELSLNCRREWFAILTREIARQLAKKRILETTVLREFESWRKERVEAPRHRKR
jgi:hypothetical protein